MDTEKKYQVTVGGWGNRGFDTREERKAWISGYEDCQCNHSLYSVLEEWEYDDEDKN